MEDIYEKILFSYGLKLYATQRTRRGLICRTDKGTKELRKTSFDKDTICFENGIKKYLYSKGFKDTDVYLETTEETPFYEGLESNYVLSDFVQVFETDMSDLENAKKAVETMALIHKLSCGFDEKGKVSLGKLPETIKKRRTELVKIKKWISAQSKYSPLDIVVVKNYDYFLERAKRAETLVNSKGYEKTVNLALQRQNICHNNLKGDSLRTKENSGELYITGFERSSFDCGVSDLAGFLRRQIKDESCNAQKIDELIKAYNNVVPIEDFELETLGAMILFPAKVFKICNTYYNKRRVLINEAVLDKLKKAITISEKEERILNELKLIR